MHETRGVKFKKEKERVKRAAKACLFVLGKEAKVEIHCIEDEEMRAINKKFRGKDKVTNVLSFEEGEDFPRPDARGKKCLGEVYLAPNYIKRKGESIEELVIHGILHLAGYTHDNMRDRMKMEKKELEIISCLAS